jgi:hypothetical protein
MEAARQRRRGALPVTKKIEAKPPLRLIQGGLSQRVSQGVVQVVLAPREQPPFAVDATVVEEDTYLVLSADPRAGEPHSEHPIRVMTSLLEVQPREPGTILVRDRFPIEIAALVHDLDEEPSWREEWVTGALDHALLEAERRQLRSLGLEMLGAVHGRLERPRFLQLLRQSLQRFESRSLERIWLIPPGSRQSAD